MISASPPRRDERMDAECRERGSQELPVSGRRPRIVGPSEPSCWCVVGCRLAPDASGAYHRACGGYPPTYLRRVMCLFGHAFSQGHPFRQRLFRYLRLLLLPTDTASGAGGASRRPWHHKTKKGRISGIVARDRPYEGTPGSVYPARPRKQRRPGLPPETGPLTPRFGVCTSPTPRNSMTQECLEVKFWG